MRQGKVWSFETARFRVVLEIQRDYDYKYDGDDEDGETQRKLDAGDYVCFDSVVKVFLDDELQPIGWDSLSGSVYDANDVEAFWRDHRTSVYEGRNTLEQKARGVVICHYFPYMVTIACDMARKAIVDRKASLERLPPVRTKRDWAGRTDSDLERDYGGPVHHAKP